LDADLCNYFTAKFSGVYGGKLSLRYFDANSLFFRRKYFMDSNKDQSVHLSNHPLYGTPNNDILRGTAGGETIYGLEGSDRLYGDAGDDVLFGDAGNDILYGGDGYDILYGGAGSDRLYGDAGNDVLFGDAGNDILYGGDGDDILNGGAGSDRLYGGAGNNTFVLASGMGLDSIYNFQDGIDIIRLDGGLTFGDLQIAQSGTSTSIKIALTGVTLASLVNTNSTSITATDFSVDYDDWF